MNESLLGIGALAQRTGLSQHTIRAWERRYGAILPVRTDTNRRLYTVDDARKLALLQRAVASGHQIGHVATLSAEELEHLIRPSDELERDARPPAGSIPAEQAAAFVAEAVLGAQTLSAGQLMDCLVRAATLYGIRDASLQVILPLLGIVGERWHRGDLGIASEHIVTAAVRSFLGQALQAIPRRAGALRLAATTPTGQFHELGALIAGVIAAAEGWDVLYLGPNLPAQEIARAAREFGARAVALSIVWPADDSGLADELARLRQSLDSSCALVVGGAATDEYRAVLTRAGALIADDIDSLSRILAAL